MPRRTIHNATVTLKLPFDIGASAELTALRAAGIPVDAMGNAERGFLFVRSTNGRRSQTTSFDGLPAKWGRCPANCVRWTLPALQRRARTRSPRPLGSNM